MRIAIDESNSLYRYAQAHATTPPLIGRGPAYRLTPPVSSAETHEGAAFAGAGAASAGEWLVRRYRRGGAVASLLGERYLRLGTPRPVREMSASDAARARDVPAARTFAAVVYPAGVFYTADLATEFVRDAVTLADLSFGDGGDAARRTAAWGATGRLVARAASAGILHADLNLRNVLIRPDDGDVSALLIDLDRCSVQPPARGATAARRAARMYARLHRSRRKLERVLGTSIPDAAIAAFDDALRSALAAET